MVKSSTSVLFDLTEREFLVTLLLAPVFLLNNKFICNVLLTKKTNMQYRDQNKKDEAGYNSVTIIKNIGFTREGYKNHHYIGAVELLPT